MPAESKEWNIIQLKVIRIVNLKAFLTPKIVLAGMVTLIIQMLLTMTGRRMTKLMQRKVKALRIQNT